MMNKMNSFLLVGSLLAATACVISADILSYNFLVWSSEPLAFKYTGNNPFGIPNVSTLTGTTNQTQISFAGGYLGSPIPGAQYQAILTISATDSTGDNAAFKFSSDLDTLTATWVAAPLADYAHPALAPANAAALAGKILLQVKAGSAGGTDQGGMLSATGSTGGMTGNDASLPTSNPLVFSSDVINTAGYTNESYAFTLALDPSAIFSYTSTGIGTVNYLDSFIAAMTGNGRATTPVPEPGSVALSVGALVSIGALRLRRRRK